MNERITFIAVFNNENLAKISSYINPINTNLCKVPFSKNISNREEVDTLPYHFTLISWVIKDEEFVINELSKITFPKLKIIVNDIKIMNGKENSYVLYFNIEENKELKLLHQKIYQILPNEKYNPKNFEYHITIHIDKDYIKITKMKKNY